MKEFIKLFLEAIVFLALLSLYMFLFSMAGLLISK